MISDKLSIYLSFFFTKPQSKANRCCVKPALAEPEPVALLCDANPSRRSAPPIAGASASSAISHQPSPITGPREKTFLKQCPDPDKTAAIPIYGLPIVTLLPHKLNRLLPE
jgi:hypothetical protein